MITVIKKKKRINCGHLRDVNLCETSLVSRNLVPEVATLEDTDESVIVHL